MTGEKSVTDALAVEFEAEIRQVKTMADGSCNIILNLPETCREQAQWFLAHVLDVGRGVFDISPKEYGKRKQNVKTKSS